MSENTKAATETKAAAYKAEEIPFEITPETHAVGLMLVSPSQLGRAFVSGDPSKVRQALDDLDLSDNGRKAAAKLMEVLDPGRSKEMQETHPTRLQAWALVARLKGIS
jgi:hypothetical protein